MNRRIIFLFAIVTILLPSAASFGAELVIGQVAPFSSDAESDAPGAYLRIGIQACFESVNRMGGIHGTSIKFVTKDRGSAPKEVVDKTRELIQEAAPVALIGLPGTGSMEALIKNGVLEQAGIAVVGIRTGAVSLHEPVNPYLFHTRANYLGEIQKILVQLSTIGINRIAVFSENSPFGRGGVALVERALQQKPQMQLIKNATYEPNAANVENAVSSMLASQPQAIISVATTTATADFYKSFREKGGKAQVVALSLTDPDKLVKRIGREHAQGLMVTELVPAPTNTSVPLIRELRDNLKKYGPANVELNATIVEGYLAAKTLVEALRGLGPNPTRKQIRSALESMRSFDAGGVIIGFSPTNHTGSKYVELAILLASGKLMR